MGLIQHHAIVATTWNEQEVQKAKDWAVENETSLLISEPKINAYTTICLPPDGSKQGCLDSIVGNDLREAFIGFLQSRCYSDGSSPWSWVEVTYGEQGQMLVNGNNDNRMGDEGGTLESIENEGAL